MLNIPALGVNTTPADAQAPSRQGISRHGIGCAGQTTYTVVPELISSTCIGWSQIQDMIQNVNISFVNNPAC